MADVSITYKGNEISSMSATGTKTLLTEGKYCEDDITVAYTKPAAPSPSLQSKTNITPTTSSQTITADQGYDGLSSVQINAMPSGSASTPATTITATPSISVVDGGGDVLIYATVSATQSITPSVSAGYVASGTAGTVTVSGSTTNILPSKAATTYTPTTTNQTIAHGQYLKGDQLILGDAHLVAENIKKDVSIFGVTGTYEGGGGGVQTAYVDGVEASDTLYYTDASMTAQSGRFIYDAYLPIGSLIIVYNDGPSMPFSPTGVTQLAKWAVMMQEFIVYEVTG